MISILKIIQLLGLIQGAILFIIILSNKKSKSQTYLSLFILLLTLHIAAQTFINKETMIQFPYILLFIDYLPFVYGPLIYFYVHHLLFKNYKPGIPFYIHFIPAIIEIIFYLIIFVSKDAIYIRSQIALVWGGSPPIYIIIIDSLKIISGITYSIFTFLLILNNRDSLKKWINNKDHKKWLITLIVSFAICWLPVIIASIIRVLDSANNSYLIEIVLSLQIIFLATFLYIVTFFTLKYPFILNPKQIREEIKKKLNIEESEIESIKTALAIEVQNQFYTDPDITLTKTAKIINTHSNRLSFVLNEIYDMNFKQYINQFRLKRFLELADPNKLKEETILGIAFDSGFPSKSTFHRVFKEKYGISATEYLKTRKK